MNYVFVVLLSLLIIALFYVIFQLQKLKEAPKNESDSILMEWLRDMRGTLDSQLKNQSDTIHTQLRGQRDAMSEQTKLIWQRLDNAQEVIRKVQSQLGGITEFGKDIKDLSNILKSPKSRGGLGEQFLYDILASNLPKDLYRTQYKFKDGEICDAVVFTEKGIIPIDSKFPMENYKGMLEADSDELREKYKKTFISDVKRRIDEISKYIVPEQGTVDQAVMYIPSESIFYELIVNNSVLEDYCKVKSVILSSPNTLSYFLKILLVAYQKQQIVKHADDIIKSLSGIKTEAITFNNELSVLDRHVNNSYKSMDNVRSRYQKLFGKIENIQTIGEKDQTPLIS